MKPYKKICFDLHKRYANASISKKEFTSLLHQFGDVAIFSPNSNPAV
jgi:hypothetical protein